MQVEKRYIFVHLKFYSHPPIGLASALFQSVFWAKKRVFERGTLKNQTCTPSSLVQHKKLTLYANFHALPQKRRVLFFYSFKRRDYKPRKERNEKEQVAFHNHIIIALYFSQSCLLCSFFHFAIVFIVLLLP